MVSVLLGTAGLTAVVIFNFVECVRLAVGGTLLAFPYALDQKYLVLLAWGFLVPVVWGFSARWLPSFLAISKPHTRLFREALILDLAGVLCGVAGWTKVATVLLALSAVAIGLSLHLTQRPHGPAKVQGIHPQLPRFHSTRVCLAGDRRPHGHLGCVCRSARRHLGRLSSRAYGRLRRHDGLHDRAAHPSPFCRRLLHLQQAPHVSQPAVAADRDARCASAPSRLPTRAFLSFAWKTLPISGMLELSGVLVFAVNIALTMLAGKSAFAQTAGNRQTTSTA